MAKQQLLSNDNLAEVLEMIKWYRATSLGTPQSRKGQPNVGTATYLAKVPSGGISALSIGGDDVPGSATCSIYKLNYSGTGGDVKLEDMGFDDVVYNISTTQVTSRYCIVHQIKGGIGGYVTVDATGDEDTGTGSVDACVTSIAGVALGDLPISSMATGTGTAPEPAYALGLDTDGCLVLIPISEC